MSPAAEGDRRLLDDACLVEPDERQADAYRTMLADFQRTGERPVPYPLTYDARDFGALVRRLRAEAVAAARGRVPATTYWLVSGATMLGASQLRHTLNDRLLRYGGHIGYGIAPAQRNRGCGSLLLALTLQRARERGLGKVLITTAKSNVASARIVLRNGGKQWDEVARPGSGDRTLRWWIEL